MASSTPQTDPGWTHARPVAPGEYWVRWPTGRTAVVHLFLSEVHGDLRAFVPGQWEPMLLSGEAFARAEWSEPLELPGRASPRP